MKTKSENLGDTFGGAYLKHDYGVLGPVLDSNINFTITSQIL